MSETFFRSPEVVNDPNILARFHNTLQVSFADPADVAGSLQIQNQRLHEIIDAGQQQPLSESAKAQIRHYGTVVEYLWFGRHTEELPQALGYYSAELQRNQERNQEWGEISLNQDVLDPGVFEAITRVLMPLGLGHLVAERSAYARLNEPHIDAAFKALVDSTPAAQWLEAFKIQARVDAPLSPVVRDSREASLQDAGRRRIGPAPHRPSRPHPAARSYIQRQIERLDDETMPTPHPHNESRLALEALLRYVDATIGLHRDNPDIVESTFDHQEFILEERAADGTVTRHDASNIAFLAAYENLPSESAAAMDGLSIEFFMDAFDFTLRGPSSHQEVYDATLASSRALFLNNIIGGFNLTSNHSVAKALLYTKRLAANRELDTESRSSTSYYPAVGEKVTRASHITEGEIERARRQLIGVVEKYIEPLPSTTRILQWHWSEQYNLPLTPSGEADIILKLGDVRHDPCIPGYELVAANRLENRYYFMYRPDADPYRRNTTPIPTTVRADLAEQYTQANLPGLAETVHRTPTLSIAGLASAAQQHGVYTPRHPAQPDFSGMLDGLPSFRFFTQDDKLRATCSIYARFGKHSVDLLLPSDRSFITTGQVIGKAGEGISTLVHDQLAITDEQDPERIVSLIEWTTHVEGAPSETYVGPEQKNPLKLYGLLDRVLLPNPIRERSPDPPISMSEQVQRSLQHLMQQLGIVFAPGAAQEVPSDFIFTKVKALGARHPISLTLGALLRASDALQHSATLPPEYVDDCADALAEVKRQEMRHSAAKANQLKAHGSADALQAQLIMLKRTLEPVVRLARNSTSDDAA